MTQKDKELLYKDLCARLPYGVVLDSPNPVDDLWDEAISIDASTKTVTLLYNERVFYIDEVKPYLFPLSSITDEMIEELNINGFFKYRDTIANVGHLESKNGVSEEIYTYIDIESVSVLIEFFHSHHIDYRGLIEKGLALDATGLNIY